MDPQVTTNIAQVHPVLLFHVIRSMSQTPEIRLFLPPWWLYYQPGREREQMTAKSLMSPFLQIPDILFSKHLGRGIVSRDPPLPLIWKARIQQTGRVTRRSVPKTRIHVPR